MLLVLPTCRGARTGDERVTPLAQNERAVLDRGAANKLARRVPPGQLIHIRRREVPSRERTHLAHHAGLDRGDLLGRERLVVDASVFHAADEGIGPAGMAYADDRLDGIAVE